MVPPGRPWQAWPTTASRRGWSTPRMPAAAVPYCCDSLLADEVRRGRDLTLWSLLPVHQAPLADAEGTPGASGRRPFVVHEAGGQQAALVAATAHGEIAGSLACDNWVVRDD